MKPKRTKKLKIAITLLSIVLAGLIGILAFTINQTITGEVVSGYDDYYTHTKAFCTEDNFCQDFVITCENETVIDVSPITGATVQHPQTWQDPRDEEVKETLCR